MKKRNKIHGWGLALAAGALACAPIVRELGDGPIGGGPSADGGSSSDAGSGTVLPKGGRPATAGGAAGDGPSAGGADPGVCFGPNHRLDLARNASGMGCPCDDEALVCVSDDTGDVVWQATFTCVDGRWTVGPYACDQDCFSPTNRPDLAIEPGSGGCACDGEPPECVLTEHEGRPWKVGLYCTDGRWTSAEDGVCGDGRQADCKTGGIVYPHGARNIPDPTSCNTCSCDNGQLICTEIGCPIDCPEGTKLGTSCAETGGLPECGPADECQVVEHDCLPACTDSCQRGECVDGVCLVLCG